MARLIPTYHIEDIALKPERDVARALVTQLPEDCIVYHSYPWLRPERNDRTGKTLLREGETDFVIVLPRIGLLVLEVKGGVIYYDTEHHQWFRETGTGEERDIKDPFEQARVNMHSLQQQILRHSFPGCERVPCTCGYCVIFPDCVYSGHVPPGADNSVILSAEDLEHLGRRIPEALKKWCPAKNPTPLTKADLDGITSGLSPSFNLFPILFRRIEEQEEKLFRMTEEQARVLEYIQNQTRAAIEGVAGSGKTLLARARAQHFALQGMKTLLLCYNKSLSSWIRSGMPEQFEDRITVTHFHELCHDYCLNAGIPFEVPTDDRGNFWNNTAPELLMQAIELSQSRYDAVVIDEGQDFQPHWWIPVEMLLKEEGGPFYLFYDPAQNLYVGDEFSIPNLGTPICLPTNCRNTKKIAETCGRIGGQLIPVRDEAPVGDDVVVHTAEKGTPQKDTCEGIVKDWTWKGKLLPSQVAVLSPYKKENSSLSGIDTLNGIPVVEDIDEWNRGDGILFSTVRSFKGLEADAVIIMDVMEPGSKLNFTRTDFYVACSRAKHLLAVIEREKGVSGL